jgi:4-aminobutyrate aminotransferase-like enzyme
MSDKAICRSFRQDFPQFVERSEALGVRITLGEGRRNGRERVFWLDGYKQLTGYTINSEGCPFTLADAQRNIDKVLTGIEQDRAIMETLSVAERFARVMAEFRQMKPQYRMIGEVRLPGGDRGHVWFMYDYDGAVDLRGIGTVAMGKAEYRLQETGKDQMARFCHALEADFAARHAEVQA